MTNSLQKLRKLLDKVNNTRKKSIWEGEGNEEEGGRGRKREGEKERERERERRVRQRENYRDTLYRKALSLYF